MKVGPAIPTLNFHGNLAYEGLVGTAIKRADYMIKISEEALKDTEGEAEKGFKRFIRKVPVGPVLVIFAWNVRRFFYQKLGANISS